MNPENICQDERTLAIRNKSFRIAYALLAYGLLADILARAFIRHEVNWDLVVLVLAAGLFAKSYQVANKAVVPRQALLFGAVFLITAVTVSALILFFQRR